MNDEYHARALMRAGMTARLYFGNMKLAVEWLERPHPYFRNVSPLAHAMKGEQEAIEVTRLLSRMETGVYT